LVMYQYYWTQAQATIGPDRGQRKGDKADVLRLQIRRHR